MKVKCLLIYYVQNSPNVLFDLLYYFLVTDDFDQSITLIRDGCPNSSYVNVQIFSFIGEESIGFSYLAFRFLSDDYEKHQLLNLNCVVNVCLPDECPTDNYCF